METSKNKSGFNSKQLVIWMSALILGCILGMFNVEWLNNFFNFIATAYTRLFKFVAVPTIALVIATTLATLGAKKNTGRLFFRPGQHGKAGEDAGGCRRGGTV